ncbi:hypothetical protein MBAV_006118 [Candidatus Magnetobacterium bavaricum]|uniref:Uncharacterized protein n=1 Tax=Candidatus Magnetobacterium bavaricum TaxID=29290 RepID=A0A0F3GLW0_9BACT|nr:hypothetical protein MBAV_006118 [Candidatus Magnetobacterium bavaricum]
MVEIYLTDGLPNGIAPAVKPDDIKPLVAPFTQEWRSTPTQGYIIRLWLSN